MPPRTSASATRPATASTRDSRGVSGALSVALGMALLAAVVPVVSSAGDGAERPRVALVLGGGGAKGAAHIGVLEVLEQLRVPVDCVAGTSMGALVGATYAAGMKPAEIERVVAAIDWSSTVGSEGVRDRSPIRRKLEGISYTNSLEFSLKGGRLAAPDGLLRTQDIENVLRSLVSGARLTSDFDDLPLPFRAVATDLVAAEMVVLGTGDLAVAMRASMAVPGAFAPVRIDDRVLVDGGLMRNVAVDIGRDLCGDVVIAVALQVPQPGPDDLVSAVKLAGRSLDVMIDADSNEQLATMTDDDVSIIVQMGDIGSTDFARIPEAIPLGRVAALGQADALRRYAVSTAEYAAWRAGINQAQSPQTPLTAINLVGMDRVNPEVVRAQLREVAVGKPATDAEVAADTRRIYALGDFERVEYRFVDRPAGRYLDIILVEKPAGPDFFNADLGLAANGNGDLEALLRVDHRRTWINSYGGEWNSTVQIGEKTLLTTDFYQPLEIRQRVFLQPVLQYQRALEDYYDDGKRRASFELREVFGELGLGLNIDTRAQLRAGVRRAVLDARLDTGSAVLDELDEENDSALVYQFVYDTRDVLGLPTRGTIANARYMQAGTFFGGEQRYELVEGVLAHYLPWRGDSLGFILGAGAELDGDVPVTRQFRVGGIHTFPGLQRGELRGDSYWYAGSRYLWKLTDLQTLFSQAIYAGVRLQAGRIGGRLDDVDDGTLYGVSGSLGGRTPIGPFLLSLGIVDNGAWQLQLGVGRPIPEGSLLDDLR